MSVYRSYSGVLVSDLNYSDSDYWSRASSQVKVQVELKVVEVKVQEELEVVEVEVQV